MHVIWAERDARFPRDKDWRFAIRTATFGKQRRLGCGAGVDWYLRVEPKGCRSNNRRDLVRFNVAEIDGKCQVLLTYFHSERQSSMAYFWYVIL
jgi:hypothetical protein